MSVSRKSSVGRRGDASLVKPVRTGVQHRSLRGVGERTEAAIRSAVDPELLRILRRGTVSEPPTSS